MRNSQHAATTRLWARTWVKVAVVAALAAFILIVFAPAAHACAEASDNPRQCLPAFRWRNPLIWSDLTGGLLEAITSVVTRFVQGVLGLLLAVAGSIWMLLMSGAAMVSQNINSPEFLGSVLENVNGAFRAMRGYVNVAVPLAIILGLIGKVVPSIARSGGASGRVFNTIWRLIVPLGILWAMTTAAAGATDTNPTPPGSPGWFVEKGWQVVDLPTNVTMQGLGAATAGLTEGEVGGSLSDTSCVGYNNRLRAAYYSSRGDISALDKALTMALSKTWEANFLNNYYILQFGDIELGEHIGCRLLESERGVPAAIQKANNGGAHTELVYIVKSDEDSDKRFKLISWMFCYDPDNPSPLLIEEKGSVKSARNECLNWLDGSSKYKNNTGSEEDEEERRNRGTLHERFRQNEYPGRFENGNNKHYERRAQKARARFEDEPVMLARIDREERAISLLQGGLSGMADTVVGGVFAIVGVLGMAALLGIPMFGAIISSFILVFLFMFLPISLVSMALGMERIAKPVVNSTIFMVFAKSFMTLVVGMVAVFLLVGAGLLGALF